MEDFKECRDHVRNWMVESGYGYASVHPFDLLCKSLAAYFADTGVPYTPEAAEKWAILQDESPSRVRIASQNLGLARLRDVYVYGEISPFHYGRIHGTIGMGFEGELEDYLREFRQRNHAERSVSPVESACRRFALAMEAAQGAQCLRDVSCMALPAYVDLVKDGVSEKWVALQISRVCSWLRYEAELGCCHDSLWIFLNKLKSFPDCAAALDIPQGYTILRAGTSVEYPSADVVRIKTHVLLDALEKAGYKATLLGTTRWALELFYVFLDANQLNYSRELSNDWLEQNRDMLGNRFACARRALNLLGDCLTEGKVVMPAVYRKPSKAATLPDWCLGRVEDYLRERASLKLAASTLTMDRSACIRFCNYLSAEGIESFSALRPEDLKAFNRADRHDTAEGKAAYNTRVRSFLRFLERENITRMPGLHLALPGATASSERIVVTLTDAEVDALRQHAASASTPLELRDAACIALGTELGIRASDIAKLRLCDIDWHAQTIHFCQKKTGRDVVQPLPTAVGNAIFRYLRDGRPRAIPNDYVFVSVKAPYRQLSRAQVGKSLRRALPDRNVFGSGFHVTRKTFASERLKQNVPTEQIAYALGHRSVQTLKPYLSLDAEHMKLCPLSLEDLGIEAPAGGRL